MSLAERVIGLLAPPICIGCQAEGEPLCLGCEASSILPFGERCFGCNKLSLSSKSCRTCRSRGAPNHVWVVTDYDGVAKELIHKYKFSHQRIAAEPLSRLMADVISAQAGTTKEQYLLVPVPTASGRIRQRSFDHTALLSMKISAKLGLKWQPALVRLGQNQQVGAPRHIRKQQVKGAYQVVRKDIRGRRVILVDDVVTTGATLSETAKILRKHGARSVDAVVFAKSL